MSLREIRHTYTQSPIVSNSFPIFGNEVTMKNFQKLDDSIFPVQLRDRSEMRLSMPSRIHSSLGRLGVAGLLALVALFLGGLAGTAAPRPKPKLPAQATPLSKPKIEFHMVPAQATCLRQAFGEVRVTSLGPVEVMDVEVEGLPPNTDFDFFVIQVPKGPFGLAWYQGDIETDNQGEGHQRFIGRFSIETFIVAPGIVPAPLVHDQPPFPDAHLNPTTLPVHTFHLGLWFNSPKDAVAAGCPGATTPFNGDHTAGVQVLNTSNFPDDQGPLRQLIP